MKSAIPVPLAILLFLIGQSASPPTQPRVCHVRGTIADPLGGVIPGVKVTFQSEPLTTTVTTNNVGVYEADLPPGEYTMTAQGPRGFRFYRRPLFRVTSPDRAVINATLMVGPPCGDGVRIRGTQATAEQEQGISTDACEREDLIRVLSDNKVPFQVSILYGSRTPVGSTYTYLGEKTPEYAAPVFVAYNLFSLQADKIIYDVENRTIEASGNVVSVNELGTTHHADSMVFKVEDGQVALLRYR
jgi:hypothetical protein